VNTLPPAMLDAFRDHGRPRLSLTENIGKANRTMETLAKLAISIRDVTAQLLGDGVRAFRRSLRWILEGHHRCDTLRKSNADAAPSGATRTLRL